MSLRLSTETPTGFPVLSSGPLAQALAAHPLIPLFLHAIAMSEHNSRTPSLTHSEGTLASSADNFKCSSPIKLNYNILPVIEHIPFRKEQGPATSIAHSNRTSLHSRASAYYGYVNGFIRAWLNPAILSHILIYIQWKDFHSVVRTCHSMHAFFLSQEIRDVVFTRFIPGFQRVHPHDDVTVTLSDLEILMACSQIPLSSYPKLAVDSLSTRLPPSPKLQLLSDRFIRFAQVHSRFVLYLHCQASRWQYSLYTEEPSKPLSVQASPLRELTFPSPLFYPDNGYDNPTSSSTPTNIKHHLNNKLKADNTNNNNNNNNSLSDATPSTKLKAKSSIKRRPHSFEEFGSRPLPDKPRFSMFGHRNRPPPPLPQSSPPSLKYYSINRRRQASHNDNQFVNHSRYMSETLHPPRYPFASNSTNSLPASLGSSSASSSTSRNQTPPPHELGHALLPMRAPILRVFIPCSSLNQENVIIEAEHQLISAGLWEHLRSGDAVLNLGYVPTDSSLVCGWLIFADGQLRPYFPPAPLPVSNFESLPSPLYYSHISRRSNIRSFIRLPRMRLHLDLIQLKSIVPSPDSPQGISRIKHHAWIGKMHIRDEDIEPLGLGDGWAGEWILEAAGTYEGRQSLIDAVEGRTLDPRGRQWEIVGEKSGYGKVWLRMCPEPKFGTDAHTDSLFTPPSLH